MSCMHGIMLENCTGMLLIFSDESNTIIPVHKSYIIQYYGFKTSNLSSRLSIYLLMTHERHS